MTRDRIFTQQDPIGLGGGLNLYGFANGDPVNFSDPFGLCAGDGGGSGDSSQTRYGHLSQRCVDDGEYVEQGQLIGYTGETGRADGPHLHFEVLQILADAGILRGQTAALTDPLGFLQANGGAAPLDQMILISSTSPARTVLGVTRPHGGVDLRAPASTPVYAAFSGRVVVSGAVNGYGQAIYINHQLGARR